MKFQLSSDIHLDKRTQMSGILTTSAPNLVLAGDIGNPGTGTLENFLDWCSANYSTVIYVPGNHEYYLTLYDQYNIDMGRKLRKINEVIDSNIIILEKDSIIIEDCEIFGTTLWTQLPDYKWEAAEEFYNDFSMIIYRFMKSTESRNREIDNGFVYPNINAINPKDTIVPFGPQQMNNENYNCLDFLDFHLSQDSNFNQLVITHHPPTHQLTPSKYKVPECEYSKDLFANDLDNKLHEWSKSHLRQVWVSGHSHGNNICKVGNWEMHMNALGKPGENGYYKYNYVIDI